MLIAKLDEAGNETESKYEQDYSSTKKQGSNIIQHDAKTVLEREYGEEGDQEGQAKVGSN